ETIDEVYIPYYQPKTNRIEKFKPDFIFWLKKNEDYTILFIDPKGTEHTDGYRKIDGFVKIFENEIDGQKQPKTFSQNELLVRVKLLLKTNDKKNVLQQYQNYWFDNMQEFNESL
ncbi:MAG TPA: restriction endonuclease subunit R, partial [Candidatus Kapabacteria bacterium]|nr:restriction endonuclease subunit R [Candidatus Kapabacteria bacterium]